MQKRCTSAEKARYDIADGMRWTNGDIRANISNEINVKYACFPLLVDQNQRSVHSTLPMLTDGAREG